MRNSKQAELAAKAIAAIESIQRKSVEKGLHKMTLAEINAEIAAARKERKR